MLFLAQSIFQPRRRVTQIEHPATKNFLFAFLILLLCSCLSFLLAIPLARWPSPSGQLSKANTKLSLKLTLTTSPHSISRIPVPTHIATSVIPCMLSPKLKGWNLWGRCAIGRCKAISQLCACLLIRHCVILHVWTMSRSASRNRGCSRPFRLSRFVRMIVDLENLDYGVCSVDPGREPCRITFLLTTAQTTSRLIRSGHVDALSVGRW
jgi:hypothetical protein